MNGLDAIRRALAALTDTEVGIPFCIILAACFAAVLVVIALMQAPGAVPQPSAPL
jgi:hypothetical protein